MQLLQRNSRRIVRPHAFSSQAILLRMSKVCGFPPTSKARNETALVNGAESRTKIALRMSHAIELKITANLRTFASNRATGMHFLSGGPQISPTNRPNVCAHDSIVRYLLAPTAGKMV